jgi:hypothetical protein
MPTTTYQCNVCKRIIQKQDNLTGLTVFGKCIITNNCLGQLNRLDRNIDSNREVFPPTLTGLLDYTPRKAFFQFTQNLLSNAWYVKHDLSTFPAVSVYVSTVAGSALVQLDPEKFSIIIVDKNTVTLQFDQPYTGIAHFISRSTTTTNNTIIGRVPLVKITTNGLITMAVPETIINPVPIPITTMDGLGFDLEIITQEPSQKSETTIEHINPQVDSLSPWNDWPKILVRKRKNYVIRTKNILDFLAFGTNAKAIDVPNGTQIFFNRVAFLNIPLRAMNSRELMFLLSNAPYQPIDKVKDKIVDVGEMLDTPLNYFVYSDGDLYVDSSLVETSYPNTLRAN